DLGTLGGNQANGSAINIYGQVAGLSGTAGVPWHAFLWSGGLMSDLGTLGQDSYGYATNRTAQVAGMSVLTTSSGHAFLYSGAAMQDLGTFGGSWSWAFGINDPGFVVGEADTSAGATHPFLYRPGLPLQDLGTLGGTYAVAFAINNHNTVVGTST